MALSSSPYEYDNEIGTISVQQHRSQQSLHSLQQYSLQQYSMQQYSLQQYSMQNLQQRQQLRQQQNQDDISLLPYDNTECLRFYKGLARRDKKQTAPTTMIISCGSLSTPEADARCSRRRRSIRRLQRLRPRLFDGSRKESLPSSDTVEDTTAGHNLFRPAYGSQPRGPSPAAGHNPDLMTDKIMDTAESESTTFSDTPTDKPVVKSSKIDLSGPNKVRYIFNKGRMQAVEVMKWPTKNRIIPSERYRLAEPMKSVYGRRSVFRRLFKAFEISKCYMELFDPSDIHGPIPILPRRLVDNTKRSLLFWYKPIENFGEYQGAAV